MTEGSRLTGYNTTSTLPPWTVAGDATNQQRMQSELGGHEPTNEAHLGVVDVLEGRTHLHGGVHRCEVELVAPNDAKREVRRRAHPRNENARTHTVSPRFVFLHPAVRVNRNVSRL